MELTSNISINDTSWNRSTIYVDHYSSMDWRVYNIVLKTICGVFIGFGGPLNLWFIMSLLTSADLRARLKIRLVCSMFVAQLLNAWVTVPMLLLIRHVASEFGIKHACRVYAAFHHFLSADDFASNWCILLVLTLFLAQIMDIKPSMLVPQVVCRVMSFALPCLPWVIGFVVLLIITGAHNTRAYDCFVSLGKSPRISSNLFCTVIPLGLSLIVLTACAILRHRRFSAGSLPGAATVEILSRGPEIDNVLAYAAVYTMALLFDLPMAMGSLGYTLNNYYYGFIFHQGSAIFNQFRIFSISLSCLSFPEIRERIKSWRPYCRPRAAGIDLTLHFNKSTPDTI